MKKLAIQSNAKLAIIDDEMRIRYNHRYCSTDPDFIKQHGFMVLDNPNILDFCTMIGRLATDKERMINQPDIIYDWVGFHVVAKRSKSKYNPTIFSSVLVTADFIDDLFKLRKIIPNNEEILFVYMYEDKFVQYNIKSLDKTLLQKFQKIKQCRNPKTDMYDCTMVYDIPYSLGSVEDYIATTLKQREQYYQTIHSEDNSSNQTFFSNIPEELPMEPANVISPLI